MKTSEIMDLQGRLTLSFYDSKGNMVHCEQFKNDIVLSGRDLVAQTFVGTKMDPIGFLAIGTGTKPVDPNDTALSSELFRKAIKPVDLTTDLTTTPENRRKVRISTELDFNEGNGALTEGGLFNAATNGVMYNRVVFPQVNKTKDFTLTLVWEIIF